MRRAVVISLGCALGVALSFHPQPAAADLFKWVERQVGGAEDADPPRIERLETGIWHPSILGTGATDTATSSARHDNESDVGESLGETGKPREITVLADGLTYLRLLSAGLVPALELTAYLNNLARKLLAVSPVTGVPADVRITGARGLGDAIAMQDGVIGIPIGILVSVESEDELAGVLAHELSHVILNHHDSEWLARTNKQLVSSAEIGMGAMLQISQALGPADAGLGRDLQGATSVGSLIAEGSILLTDSVLTPSWSRAQEFEADELGFDLLVRAGYDVDAYALFLDRLQRYEAENPRQGPRSQLREELEAQAGQSKDPGGALKAAIGVMLLDLKTASGLEDRHPEPAERQERLADYRLAHYDGMQELYDRQANVVAWQILRQDARHAALFDNYRNAWLVGNLLAADKLADAEEPARASVADPTSDHSLPRLNFARLREAQGDRAKHQRNLEIALGGQEPSMTVYREAIRLKRRAPGSPDADLLLVAAWDRFKRPPELYPLMIERAVRKGDRQEANRLTTTCRLIFRDQSEPCMAALQGRLSE